VGAGRGGRRIASRARARGIPRHAPRARRLSWGNCGGRFSRARCETGVTPRTARGRRDLCHAECSTRFVILLSALRVMAFAGIAGAWVDTRVRGAIYDAALGSGLGSTHAHRTQRCSLAGHQRVDSVEVAATLRLAMAAGRRARAWPRRWCPRARARTGCRRSGGRGQPRRRACRDARPIAPTSGARPPRRPASATGRRRLVPKRGGRGECRLRPEAGGR